MAKTVLVINSGSSSIKYQLVDLESGEGLASGLVEKIGEPVDGHYKHEYNGEKHELEEPIHDHEQGLKRVLGFFEEYGPNLSEAGIVAVGHRVVQGGSIFPKPALVTNKTINQVKDLAVLAPLHNGPEAKGAEVMRSLLPDVPQIFVFDSSFFFQLPKAASTYALNKEIAELKEQETSYKAKWQSEKQLVNKIQENKKEIEQLKFEADKAEREGDYGRVAEIRYGKLQALENEIKSIQEDLKHKQGDNALIKEEVTAEDIADVVSRWTGIPVSKMLQSEREKLLHLEDELHKRVIGQDEAIQAVADAVRRSRAGLQDPKRPIGSFIFLGTTGVGKTELAKALAEYLFDDESLMTRIDMSEYQEKHTVSRLIGAPPGYVGYDEGGQLTEAVRRKPYSVVLFDEIEKAHPDVFNILLQVLDDGRLTDNKGRTVNFKNTIIIMTSNLGSAYIQSQFEKINDQNHDQIVEETKTEVMNMLKKTIRPEFLNRIDETIMFQPLNRPQIEQIVRLQINGIQKMLNENGVTLRMTDEAVDFIATAGYDPEFGARPVKRAIQRYLLNDLSKKLLSQEVDRSKPIIVERSGDSLKFRN